MMHTTAIVFISEEVLIGRAAGRAGGRADLGAPAAARVLGGKDRADRRAGPPSVD